MNFLLSDEQLEMQRSVERYLQERCASQRLHEAFDSPADHDDSAWQGLCDLGVAGMMLPEPTGGMGLEMIDLAAVAEVIGRAAAPVPFFGHVLAGLAIMLGGSPAQRERWLPALASGERLATVAFCEDGGRWQPEQWTVEAAEGTLTGNWSFVPAGQSTQLVVVGLKGGRMAVIERGAAGLEVLAQDGVDRSRRIASLRLDATPAELLEGAVGLRVRDAALVLLAADAFGGAARCVDMAVEYAKVREQFGKPIGRFQGLKHQIVNMAIEVEPARGIYWHAAHAWDHLPEQTACSAALAKAHLGERFMQAARDTVEAHGGIGYTWEYDLQILFKRAMFDYAWMGAPAEHRVRVADLAGW